MGLKFGSYKKYDPICINILSFIICSIIWYFISYCSYYHGLDSSAKLYYHEYYKQATNIIANTNYSLPDCTNELELLASASITGITVMDPSNKKIVTLSTNSFIFTDATPSTLKRKFKNFKTNKGKFNFTFSYSVEPELHIGLIRSISCSLSDIFGTDKEYNKSPFLKKCKKWAADFFKERHWRRSIHLYIPLTIFLAVGYLMISFWNQEKISKNELEAANKQLGQSKSDLEEANQNLEQSKNQLEKANQNLEQSNNELVEANRALEEFRTIHQKMYSDLSREINQIKQPLQQYNFSWDTYIEKAFSAERHDLKNKFPSLYDEKNFTEIEKTISDKFKNEYLHKFENAVLNNMKNLPGIVTYELQDISLDDTLKAITMKEAAIPQNFLEEKAGVDFNLTKIEPINTEEGEFCKINSHRLSSIVFNILENANQQCSRKLDEAILNNEEYISRIWMHLERVTIDSKDYISVIINDNAGGFSDDIINEVYKKPVKSSKKENNQKRTGEGTVYVSFFANYMNIKITAENRIAKDNNKGAKVSLLIPIYTC